MSSDDANVEYGGDLTLSDLAPVDLEEALGRRRSGRRRVLGVVIAVLLCAAFAAVVGYPLIDRMIPVPASSASNTSAIQVVVATNITTAGVFTVNGRKRSERMAVSFTPRDGDNTVVLTAPPFVPRTCHFRWSDRQIAATNGQCQTAGNSFVSDNTGIHSLADEITMPLLPSDLPAAQQRAATDAIGRLASAPQTITVPKGDYYALGIGTGGTILSQRAATPLTATFTTLPDLVSLEPIALFLLNGIGRMPRLPDHAWLLRANMIGSWQFTTANGAATGGIEAAISIIQQTEFALDYTLPSLPQVPFDLYGGSFDPSNSIPCAAGLQVLQQIFPNMFSPQPPGDCVDRGLAGSAFSLVVSASNGIQGATTDSTPPRFIYRFGVLLAANAEAHIAVPTLPQAPADEIIAVTG